MSIEPISDEDRADLIASATLESEYSVLYSGDVLALDARCTAAEAALAEVNADWDLDLLKHTTQIRVERDAARAEADKLRALLRQCLADFEDASQYKGEHLRAKHEDDRAIAEYRAALGGS